MMLEVIYVEEEVVAVIWLGRNDCNFLVQEEMACTWAIQLISDRQKVFHYLAVVVISACK